MLCGYNSYGAMAEWARHYGGGLAQALGFPNGKTPAVGTLFHVFSGGDKAALEKALAHWAHSLLQHLPLPETTPTALSLDGKTLRSSKKQAANESPLLSALSHGLGLTLLQRAVPDKTNEIGAVQAVLAGLVLEGRVVTVDALLTQKEVARQIRALGGTT
jgi:hypothetical protein